jgi:hypothetical protein
VISFCVKSFWRLFDSPSVLAFVGESLGPAEFVATVRSVPGVESLWTKADFAALTGPYARPVDVVQMFPIPEQLLPYIRPQSALNAQMYWIGDSGSKVYIPNERGVGPQSRPPKQEILKTFPYLGLRMASIVGATQRTFADKLRNDADIIVTKDIVVVNTFLNSVLTGKKRKTWSGEPVDLAPAFDDICESLKNCKRALIVLGASAMTWGYPPE